jgi:hypothetical protein
MEAHHPEPQQVNPEECRDLMGPKESQSQADSPLTWHTRQGKGKGAGKMAACETQMDCGPRELCFAGGTCGCYSDFGFTGPPDCLTVTWVRY